MIIYEYFKSFPCPSNFSPISIPDDDELGTSYSDEEELNTKMDDSDYEPQKMKHKNSAKRRTPYFWERKIQEEEENLFPPPLSSRKVNLRGKGSVPPYIWRKGSLYWRTTAPLLLRKWWLARFISLYNRVSCPSKTCFFL